MRKDKSTSTFVTVGDAELKVEGNISSGSNIAVSGKIHGDITTGDKDLMITNVCTVNGNISGNQVIIEGAITGNVKAHKLVLHAGGCITGDVDTELLCVDNGGYINGKVSTRTPKATPMQDSRKKEV